MRTNVLRKLAVGMLLLTSMGRFSGIWGVDTSWWQGVNVSDWYPFSATSTTDPGEIGLRSWLNEANKHGRPMRDGDKFPISYQ